METPTLKNLFPLLGQQQVASLITSNILTIIGISIGIGLYNLAGDYLITFVFMIIFAIALAAIRNTLIENLEATYQRNHHMWRKYKIYNLHSAKFSIVFKAIISLYLSLTSLKYLKSNFQWLKDSITSTSFIPYAFGLYLIVYKLEGGLLVIMIDSGMWLFIDIVRAVNYPLKKLARSFGRTQALVQFSPNVQTSDGLINWVKTSSVFTQILFISVLLSMILIVPISLALMYQDIQTYKQDLIPKLQKIQIPEEYSQYMTSEFLLSQLEGQYLSENTIKQLSVYLNQSQQQSEISLNFLEVFYGNNAEQVFQSLKKCEDSLQCKLQVAWNNVGQMNSQVYELSDYFYKYLQQALPQIKQFAGIIFQFLLALFQGSIQFLVKFIIFQQGVLYLLTSQTISMESVIILNLHHDFKVKLIENIKKHISGVFVSLFSIFLRHFMLSYIFLDLIGIKLAFIQSVLIGLFSLIQIVDPGVLFIIINIIWQFAGYLFNENSIFQLSDIGSHQFVLGLLLPLSFYIFSGQIYLHTFQSQLGDAYWNGFALVLGYLAFQWKGLIFGPLLISAWRTLSEILQYYMEMNANDKQKPVENRQKIKQTQVPQQQQIDTEQKNQGENYAKQLPQDQNKTKKQKKKQKSD